MNLSNAQINFFEVEIRNEQNGGISPATLGSAYDSLNQAPADVIVEWCNDDTVRDPETVADFVMSIKIMCQRFGTFNTLESLLPSPEDKDEDQASICYTKADLKYPIPDKDDGTNGQDRESYSDTQDRNSYSVNREDVLNQMSEDDLRNCLKALIVAVEDQGDIEDARDTLKEWDLT